MVSLALDGAHLPTEGEGWWAGLGFRASEDCSSKHACSRRLLRRRPAPAARPQGFRGSSTTCYRGPKEVAPATSSRKSGCSTTCGTTATAEPFTFRRVPCSTDLPDDYPARSPTTTWPRKPCSRGLQVLEVTEWAGTAMKALAKKSAISWTANPKPLNPKPLNLTRTKRRRSPESEPTNVAAVFSTHLPCIVFAAFDILRPPDPVKAQQELNVSRV